MNENYAQTFIDLGISLTTLAVKGTASIVNKKIKAAKDEKNIKNLRAMYDELINEVILEREEAVRIAQAYKSELDRIVISDEDIEHLHETVSKILRIVNAMQMVKASGQGAEAIAKAKATADTFEQIKDLISIDTLKTMQLLGFNYKAAIGEPLTEICANKINNFRTKNSNTVKTNGKTR